MTGRTAIIDLLDQRCETYVTDLDSALKLIAKIGKLYQTLSAADKAELLRNVVEKVFVNAEGLIVRVELLPPFAYLRSLSDRVSAYSKVGDQSENTTSDADAGCSMSILDCGCTKSQFEHPLPLEYRTQFIESIAFPQSGGFESFSILTT